MSRVRRLDAWRCTGGHVYLHPHTACPACDGRVAATHVPPDATLIATTTVRVNPSGTPFVLGIAVTSCGKARTLCHVEGGVRGSGHDAVVLERRGKTIVARAVVRRPPGAAPTDCSRAGSPTREDRRRS